MRVITLKTILRQLIKNKWRSICVLVAVCLLFGYVGVKEINDKLSTQDEEYQQNQNEIEVYNARLEAYDATVKAQEENLVTAQAQYDRQKEYCDNSIFMQIDSNNVQVAETQYLIRMNNAGADTALEGVIASITNYINSGKFSEDVHKLLPDTEPEYINELVTCEGEGNVVVLQLIHYDQAALEKLNQAAQEVIAQQCEELRALQGDFDISVASNTVFSRINYAVLNTQNGVFNNLRSYASAVSDIKRTIAQQQIDKNTYAKNNKPGVFTPLNAKKKIAIIVKNEIIGVLLASILLVMLEVCVVLFGKTIKSMDYFDAVGVNTLEHPVIISGSESNIERLATDLGLSMKSAGMKKLYVDTVSVEPAESDSLSLLLDTLKKQLKDSDGIVMECGQVTGKNTEDLKKMSEADQVMLLVQMGKTLYNDLDSVLAYTKRFHCEDIRAAEWRA